MSPARNILFARTDQDTANDPCVSVMLSLLETCMLSARTTTVITITDMAPSILTKRARPTRTVVATTRVRGRRRQSKERTSAAETTLRECHSTQERHSAVTEKSAALEVVKY